MLNQLKCNKSRYIYNGDFTEASLKPAYEDLMKQLSYSNYPIFCVVKGFFGTTTRYGSERKNDIVMQLKVPKDKCKFQYYYDWSDYIYFRDMRDEWDDGATITLEQYLQELSNISLVYPPHIRDIQYVIPYIEYDWLDNIIINPDKFLEYHELRSNIVNDIEFYKI